MGRVPWDGMPRAQRPDDDAVLFGAIVKLHRQKRGWTIADLCRKSGMNATWLGTLEQGGNMPSLSTIFKLGDALGVDGVELVRQFDIARREPDEDDEE